MPWQVRQGVSDEGSLMAAANDWRAFARKIYSFRARDQAVHATVRLAVFTDAILAIAATVLVLDLHVTSAQPGSGLIHQIDAQRATPESTGMRELAGCTRSGEGLMIWTASARR